MPTASRQPCAHPTCPALVVAGCCAQHAALPSQQRDNVTVRRWYRTARWRRLRAGVLREQPLCVTCEARGETVASRAVDHVVPHMGDAALFWARANVQGLCEPCHGRKTRRGQ